jgi:hypothetical protein
MPSHQLQELVRNLQGQMEPGGLPETVREIHSATRPIPPHLTRALEQQTQWQESFREISRRLEHLNSISEAAAEEEGIPAEPPSGLDDSPERPQLARTAPPPDPVRAPLVRQVL